MTHRRSRASAAALLTMILSLVFCAAAWAQDGDEPTSSDDPAVQGQGTDAGGETPGAEGSGANNCDPNYEDACLDPNAKDYDCEGGSGDGPQFVSGPFRRVGDDPFDLDRDGNGIACEESSDDSGGGYDSGGYDGGTPSGSVDSGYGPVPPTREASLSLPLVGAGVGLLLVVGLGGARLRRAG